MSERYSGRDGESAAEGSGAAPLPLQAALALLFPQADVALLARALADEGAQPPRASAAGAITHESEWTPAERELHRVRAQVALGEVARTMQHALNNPLTALMAEAQLLQLEPLPAEQAQAVARIVELARRMVALTRQLGG